jgi:hypothetical protein
LSGARGGLKINYFRDTKPTLAANPSSLGATYRCFALSSARNTGQMMRAPARSLAKINLSAFEYQDIN